MWFKKQKQQPIKEQRTLEVREIYKDSFGNRWFEYVNPLQLPAKRAIAAEVATRFAEMNITKENLRTLMAEMKKRANEGNIVEVFQLLAEIEFRLEFLGEEETLLELACCYFLLNDEDEMNFSEVHKAKKREILLKDGAAKDFFIQGAYLYTIQYSGLSEIDILDYLNQNAPNAQRLQNYMRDMKLASM